MPLSFQSTSHGRVAFGFFNIESDMLLLENYFFFADRFCGYINDITMEHTHPDFEAIWQVFQITDHEKTGDLMEAIHGIRHTGFMGELYEKFPFPGSPGLFKQKTKGKKTQATVQAMIQKYARLEKIPFFIVPEKKEVIIGVYHFPWDSFHELIQYVWLGGYPRWEDGERPDYVIEMKERIKSSENRIFHDLTFES